MGAPRRSIVVYSVVMKLSKTRWTSGGSVAVTGRFNHARGDAPKRGSHQLGTAEGRPVTLAVEGVHLRPGDGLGERPRRGTRPLRALGSDEHQARHDQLLQAEAV